jgi:cell division protein FtsQ
MIAPAPIPRAKRPRARRVVVARWSPRRLWTGARWHRWRKTSRRWRAAVSLPEAWRRHARGSLLAAIIGITVAGVLWVGVPSLIHAFKTHPYFAVRSIEVDGNRRLDRATVLEWAGVSVGQSAWDATPSVVRRRLLRHPWVLTATVHRVFPQRLEILVRERRPVAIVVANGLRYVDQYGQVLGELDAGDSRDFPLFTGLDAPEATGFLAAGVHRALQVLRLCERLRMFDPVSEIRVERDRGVTIFPQQVDVAVTLGWGNWRSKLTRAERVLAAWQQQAARLASVDVSFRDQVVVRFKEGGAPPVAPEGRRGVKV